MRRDMHLSSISLVRRNERCAISALAGKIIMKRRRVPTRIVTFTAFSTLFLTEPRFHPSLDSSLVATTVRLKQSVATKHSHRFIRHHMNHHSAFSRLLPTKNSISAVNTTAGYPSQTNLRPSVSRCSIHMPRGPCGRAQSTLFSVVISNTFWTNLGTNRYFV